MKTFDKINFKYFKNNFPVKGVLRNLILTIYLEAVRGRLMAEKRRSLAAREITKAVVA